MLPGMSPLSALYALILLLQLALDLASTAQVGAGSMILMDPEIPLKRCRYLRSHDLYQVQCQAIGLKEMPQNLQSSIEVLDARENRIRELRNDTLSRYTSLKFIYLQDNFVQHVAEGAFEPTEALEVLDLSQNGLLEVPRSLFQLPALRNLYLAHNSLTDSNFDIGNVRSPLFWLHLDGNKLTRLPNLRPLTGLHTLNVSHNHITRITTEDLAPLCSLKSFDFAGNPLQFNRSSCDCYELKEWIALRNIELKISTLKCPESQRERCAFPEFSNRTLSLYNACVASVQDRIEARKARSTWIWIASCIGAFVSCIFVALCCMQTRNRDKRQRLKEQEILATSNPNTEQLLNKQDLNHEQS